MAWYLSPRKLMIPSKVNQQEMISIAPYYSHLVCRCAQLFDIWQIG